MTLLVIVFELVAILANVCAPLYQGTALRWKAADIARQMIQVRTAAESARAQRGVWPDDLGPGEGPAELAAFLPPGFTFRHPDYQLDWEHWTLRQGRSEDATDQELAAITVVTHDPRLAAMVARELREGDTRMTLGNRTTLVIQEPALQAN